MAASDDGETLETLLNKATNPANREEDWEYIMNFCDRVNFELEGSIIACRLLGHKIQSPQEREALQALTVVEACVKNCGELFHKEIGKFRFLNEMIKLISPKYLGNKTTEKVKKKTIEMLYSWQTGLPNETKIREAYDMLKKQGLVKEDPTYVDKDFFPPPPPRPKNATFEDEDKSKLLSRLLKSKHPEDLQAANRLIKNMVKEDEKKTEKVARRLNELESCNNNVKLLNEMLAHYQPEITSDQERELMKELYLACEKLRPSLFRLASDTDEKDDSIADILQTNDSLVKVMDLYKELIGLDSIGGDGDTQLMDTGSTPKAQQREGTTSSLLDLEGLDSPQMSPFPTISQPPTGQMGNSIQSLPQQQQATAGSVGSSNSTQLLHDQLSSLGIGNSVHQAAPTASASTFTRKSVTQPTSATDLENILGPSPVPSAPPSGDAFGVFGSQPLQTPRMPVSMGMGNIPTTSNIAAPMATNMAFSTTTNMTTPSLPPQLTTHVPRPQYTPPTQMSPKSEGKQTSSAAFADLENLSKSMMQQQTAANKQVPVSQPSSTVQTAAPSPAMPIVNPHPTVPQPTPLAAVTTQQVGMTQVAPSTPPSTVLSLADVFVSLETIQPGTTPPITAYDKNGIKMVFHIGKDRPRPDVLVIVVSSMSSNTSPVKNLSFQAAVPKVMRVKLQPPSATDLPAFNPILPPAAITQVMLIANPQKKDIRLRFKVQFMLNEQQITDVGDVSSLPIQ